MLSKNIIVLIILVAYLLVNLFLGISVSRRSAKANADSGFMSNYFAGSRSMGGVVLAMTLVATYTSASSFLGGPGLASSFRFQRLVRPARIRPSSRFLRAPTAQTKAASRATPWQCASTSPALAGIAAFL